jgi:hypothetical protein
MIDYFFISSPLHFLNAANIALQNPTHRKVAVLIAKDRQSAGRYRVAAEKVPAVFDQVIDLSAVMARGRGTRSAAFRILKAEFSTPQEVRLFTGNDRRMEFQYAMHIASRAGAAVEGVYMDEGAVTYVGHKSMHSLAHRFVDPLFKKLYYGFWYKHAMTTGTSAWIRTAYVAFPDAVHPLLQRKTLVAIHAGPFKTALFRSLVSVMLEQNGVDGSMLAGLRVVLTLPHEGAYLNRPAIYEKVSEHLCARFAPCSIAIKPHPRITDHEVLARMFPGMTVLDNRIGMEMLLPLLNNGCIVAGDISSTLLTTRWLRPDLPVLALLPADGMPTIMAELYRRLAIRMITADQLREFLI